MSSKLEICISYLPTGKCSECDENTPDLISKVEIPEKYNGDEKYGEYIKENFTTILDIADELILDNFISILEENKKQEWFALFLRPSRYDLRKLRLVYGLDRNDNKTRLCRKIHSGSNIIPRYEIETLISNIYVSIPEPPEHSQK